jgi:uncharacterized protein (DUF4415 family)
MQMNENLLATNHGLLDKDDAPELTDAWFEQADLYRAGRLVKRGRPFSSARKVAVKLRLDPDVIAAFKVDGPGWQSRINQALRDWMAVHPGRLDERGRSLGGKVVSDDFLTERASQQQKDREAL